MAGTSGTLSGAGGGDAGSNSGASPTTPPTTATTIAPSGSAVTITELDAEKTFTLTKGATLVVQLNSSSPGPGPWSDPVSDGPALTRTSTDKTGPRTTGTFKADATGTVHVTATSPATCPEIAPNCGLPDYHFSVTINVVS